MSTFTPTPEQDDAIGRFLSGAHAVVQAGAGTGKTRTLQAMAEADRSRRGQYVAFNRSIVDEAGAKMPRSVTAKTMHGLAFRSTGRDLAHKLDSRRLPSAKVAAQLGIREPVKVKVGEAAKWLTPGYLASHVMRSIAVFCNSADPVPNGQHVPYIEGIDMPDAAGRRTYTNNNLVRDAIAPTLTRAWADLIDPAGQLRFSHDIYLKLWELSEPFIGADYVLFDEAQDASPVMASIVYQQRDHAQLVYVGDSQQAIYGWRGAVDALDQIDGAERTFLTQSFRFGPAIADMANACLNLIPGAELRLTGTESIPSVIGDVINPDAYLCRTNARAMREFLDTLTRGERPHLVGGGGEIVSFAKAWISLRDEGWTPHPELSCFKSPAEVEDYVATDPQGSDLALLFQLVDEHTPETLIEALEDQGPESAADVVISTAHKAKGREWESVTLADDFPDPEERDVSDEEMRLLYVAVTRAQLALDVSGVALLRDLPAAQEAAI